MIQYSAKNLPSPSLMSMTRLILDNGTRRICLYGLPLLSFIACRLLVVLGLFRELNALERFLHTYTKRTINKVKFTLEQAMKTQRSRRGILSLTLVLGGGGGWGGNRNTKQIPQDPNKKSTTPQVFPGFLTFFFPRCYGLCNFCGWGGGGGGGGCGR